MIGQTSVGQSKTTIQKQVCFILILFLLLTNNTHTKNTIEETRSSQATGRLSFFVSSAALAAAAALPG